MDMLEHALRSTDRLAATVADFEAHCSAVLGRPPSPREKAQRAIQIVWPRLVMDARDGKVRPKAQYVAAIYEELARAAGTPDSDKFSDRVDIPWDVFYEDGCGDEARCEDAWVVAELFWGGYVQHLQLTLGWLIMNAIRIQQNLPVLIPAEETLGRFAEFLRAAGPDTFDAESLRALFGDYEAHTAG